ncbi:MAG TPA: nucleotidyltransferase domain-containing protein [Candidatus Tripitaka californicus]|uniref:nucleotidyltransferase domain-containing protein n=1 Tax=Candidatus Tripitaka californicus TaxID=3367616 RepID=UPI004027AD17|nr:nucleotidyltransferase domain-containing protein [Planctomycetota bacterium]
MIAEDKFDKEIRSILEQLIRVYKPEKVILFGSLARGERREGTDIDLFIIKRDIPDLGVDRIRQLDTLIKYKLATDFIVYKPQEMSQRVKLGDPFIKSILKEGKVLYAAG